MSFKPTRHRCTALVWIVMVNGLAHAVVAEETIRIATFNVSLYGTAEGQIRDRLADGSDAQAEKIAAIVQTVRPDVLLVNEIDHDSQGQAARLLAELFFARGQPDPSGNLMKPMEYPYVYAPPSNTGVDSQMDLNRNGQSGEANDAWGYGKYPGQYAMALYSRFPIDRQAIRTFQTMRWSQMPGALRPIDPESGASYYDDATWRALRLSSKNHIDVPIVIGNQTIHALACHPTPPVFDGPEDRNGHRNHDEIRFWVDYLAGQASDHLVDDRQVSGGIAPAATVVIMGDLNADPNDGDGRSEAINSLLGHRRLQDPKPQSKGSLDGQPDGKGPPAHDTASFRHGNMRVDYVLPSRDLVVVDQGVFWPTKSRDEFRWISASDHRLVWIEVKLP